MKRFALLIAVLLLLSAPPLAAQAAPRAEFVLTDGRIYTVDPQLGVVEAIAISQGKIVAVGTSVEIRHWVGPQTRVVDLEGKFVLPGFNDAHTHFGSAGLGKLTVDVEGTRSLAEFQERIRSRLAEFAAGEWVTGRGWDHSLWVENRIPTRYDLDAVSTTHPLLFGRVDGHSVVVNSLALEKAGVTRDTPNPQGGEIVRDERGEPTGWLKEKAIDLVARLIPEPTREQRKRGLRLALEEAARLGVTSIQDNSDWEDFLALRELKQEGRLTLRVSEWLPFDTPVARLEEMRQEGGTTDPWLKTGALKGVTDGSGGSLSAGMLEPFANAPDNRGILRYDPAQLERMVIERDAAGFQIALHAIGDRANRVTLDAFAVAKKLNRRRNTRHRIEHAQFVHPDDVARFRELGVIASMQPCHVLNDLRWAPTILGRERAGEGYAWNSLLRGGAMLAFGTDHPVEPLNPMRGLYASITREFEEGGPLGGWLPEEKVSIADAIRAYTLGSAFAEGEEHRKGTLSPGKFADLVVLSDDVTRLPASEVLRAEVLLTMVGGRIVYEKK
ncbi:MAG: amidohydrolase family protein [Acidobacteria bacterium]|nr:amidohydrolase family protein [Acidobacteriota bacterium]